MYRINIQQKKNLIYSRILMRMSFMCTYTEEDDEDITFAHCENLWMSWHFIWDESIWMMVIIVHYALDRVHLMNVLKFFTIKT